MRSSLWMAVLAVLLAAAGHAVAGYVDAVLADDPLLYWRLGESDTSDGQTAVNAATAATTPGSGLGAAADGTYKTSVASVAGALYGEGDKAASFGPTYPDHVVLNPFPTSPSGFPSTEISAEFWMRSSDPADCGVISYAVGNNDFLIFSPASTRVYVDNPSGTPPSQIATTGVKLNDGEWNHVVVNWRSSDGLVELYKNGSLAHTDTGKQQGHTITGAGSLVLAQEQDSPGGFDTNQKYTGDLDEVALYDTVLSATAVAGHYRAAWEKSVVACNVAVNSSSVWSVEEGGPAVMTVPSAANLGDTQVRIGAQPLYATDGVMLATVREDGRGGNYATVEVDRTGGTFGNGALSIATDRAVGDVETEMDINVAAAFFPFAGYWTGGHVNATGTLVAANGISKSMLTHTDPTTYPGRYELKMPGVHSWDDGMLFAVGGSDSDKTVGAFPISDGSGWVIDVKDNDENYTPGSGSVQDDFSFLYMPYSAANLVGGLIRATDGFKLRFMGDFDMTYLDTGKYHLSIPGKTPLDGMLLLTCADEVGHTGNRPQDNILMYEASGNDFIIHGRDLTGLSHENTRFVFAYIDFEDPPVLPEPATLTLLALGGLGALLRRRRSR